MSVFISSQNRTTLCTFCDCTDDLMMSPPLQRLACLLPLLSLVMSLTCYGKARWSHQWPEFRNEQYMMLPILSLGNVLLLKGNPANPPRWRGPAGDFDDWARRGLLLGDKNSRTSIGHFGDSLLFGLVLFPFVFDSLIPLMLSGATPQAAVQMTLISLQSFLITGIVTTLSKNLASRERPYQQECARDPNYDNKCGSADSRKSFISGHSSLAFTGAGLICAHRSHMKLWGGQAVCYTAIGAATIAAFTRVASDKHFFTDILVGGVVGWVSGYTLPSLLHYKATQHSTLAVAPYASKDSVGVMGYLRF